MEKDRATELEGPSKDLRAKRVSLCLSVQVIDFCVSYFLFEINSVQFLFIKVTIL